MTTIKALSVTSDTPMTLGVRLNNTYSVYTSAREVTVAYLYAFLILHFHKIADKTNGALCKFLFY